MPLGLYAAVAPSMDEDPGFLQKPGSSLVPLRCNATMLRHTPLHHRQEDVVYEGWWYRVVLSVYYLNIKIQIKAKASGQQCGQGVCTHAQVSLCILGLGDFAC